MHFKSKNEFKNFQFSNLNIWQIFFALSIIRLLTFSFNTLFPVEIDTFYLPIDTLFNDIFYKKLLRLALFLLTHYFSHVSDIFINFMAFI